MLAGVADAPSDQEVVFKRYERIASELYELAKLYYAEHDQWPTSVDQLVSLMEEPDPQWIDPSVWKMDITNDSKDFVWKIKIYRTDVDFDRTFEIH